MNILIFEHKNFGIEDVISALKNLSHNCTCISTQLILERRSTEFNNLFEDAVSKAHYDIVFTFNYSVSVSNCCNAHNIPYVAWVYDSPLVSLYSYSITNPVNHVFLFDKTEYFELKNGGINTVYYSPLAVNVSRLDGMTVTSHIEDIFKSDISFVGSMYNEKHNLFERLDNLPPYVSGYLNGIMQAQRQVYGAAFLESVLTDDILSALNTSVPYKPNFDGVETPQYIYANYFLCRKIAQMDRSDIIRALAATYDTAVYTHNPIEDIPSLRQPGAVDYYDTMPYVFKCSKINLNISLRSIKSGIPLRALDIMGAGGFLLSNYQADFFDYFNADEDFVYYDSTDDLLAKCRYYLSHDSQREQIASNGYAKIKEYHTYEKRLTEIFNML